MFSSHLGRILPPFRFATTRRHKIATFSISAVLTFRFDPFEYLNEPFTLSGRSYRVLHGVIRQWRFYDPSFLCFDEMPARDRQTDRHNKLWTMAITACDGTWLAVKTRCWLCDIRDTRFVWRRKMSWCDARLLLKSVTSESVVIPSASAETDILFTSFTSHSAADTPPALLCLDLTRHRCPLVSLS